MIVNTSRVEDICEFIGGSQPEKSEFIYEEKPGYVRLIQTRDYKTDAFLTYIPESSTRKFCDEYDVMIGRYGPPIFQICRGLKGAYNVALMKAKPKKGIDREFLYYFLKQDAVLQYVERLSARTGGQTGVDLVSLNKYPVRVPNDIQDQRRLVASLVAIDKKIELNNLINAELEAMAKTLYDYWFVQFDFPDANGKPYKNSGGKMVYNPALKREIPEGWDSASLVDIATFTNGIACQKYYPTGSEPTYKVIKIREFSSGFDDSSESVHQGVPEKVVVNDGDILFSWSATLDVKLWTGGKGALNQHIFKVTSDSYPKSFYYFEVLKYLEYFKMVAELRKTTMGHITKDHLIASRICLPPKELIQAIDAKLSPMLSKIIINNQQNIELAKLRDWLLPMLMNGQITVR